MMQFKVLAAILMILGLFILFRVDAVQFIGLLLRPWNKKRKTKERIDRIVGKTPSRLRQMFNNSQDMLESADMGDLRKYQLGAVLLAVAGVLIGTAMNNILAAIVLALGMALIPVIYIQIKTGVYIRNLNESIETALSVVTSAYVQSGDLIDAVKSSLKAIPAPMDDIFRKFLFDVEMIDSNVVQALYNMENRVERRHFKEWCAAARHSQSDREIRYTMPGIVERLSEYRQVQMETDTAMRRMYTDYGLMVAIILSTIPMMAMIMPGWFDALMNTVAGKIALAIVLLAIFLCSIGVVVTNRPIDAD